MSYAQQRNANSFGILDSFNSPPSNESYQVSAQCIAKPIPRHISAHPKSQQNVNNHNPQQLHVPVRLQNGCTRPGFTRAPSQRQDFLRDKPPNYYPAQVPPRFRNNPQVSQKRFYDAAPLPCSGPSINPCLTPTPLCSETDVLNSELRMHLLLMQAAASPETPLPITQLGPPITQNTIIEPTPVLRFNQNTTPENNIPPSIQHSTDCRQTRVLAAASPVPTNLNNTQIPLTELNPNIPSPPSLSRRQEPRVTMSVNDAEIPPEDLTPVVPPPPGLSKRVQQPHVPTSTDDMEAPPKESSPSIPPPPGLSRVRQPQVLTSTGDVKAQSNGLIPSIPPPPGLSRRVQQPQATSINDVDVKEIGPNIPPPPGLSRQVRLPQIPELVSRTRTPTSAGDPVDSSGDLKVSIPPPPGLPRRRGGRLGNRGRGSMRPHRFNQAIEYSNFERYNGPMDSGRVISPPPAGAALNFKLPASQNVQPASPATSVSSLTEDLSGSSSTQFNSDTTFTSVDSNFSDNFPRRSIIPKGVCRDWIRGSCCRVRCRFAHPPQPNQPAIQASQPTSLLAPPSLSAAVKKPIDACDPALNSARMRDPPKVNVEPPTPNLLYATTISGHIKVRFDQGFEVRDVVTGFESRWVHIGNLAGSVTSVALNEHLWPYKVDDIALNESSGRPTTAKVQFATAADAIKAVTKFNGTEFWNRTITAKLAINNSLRGGMLLTDTDVQLVWECPFRTGYAGYDTLQEAKAALDTLNGCPMEHSVVSAHLYEGLPCVGMYNVMFKHLPANVTDQGFRRFSKSNDVMMERPNYQSLDKAIQSIRSRLEEYGTVTSFDVLPAPYRDGLVKAWARFTSPAEARAAQEDMDRRRPKSIGHTTLSCRHVVSVSHSLSAGSYRRMREDISWLRWSWHRRYGPCVSIREKVKENDEDTSAFIRLSSEQPELLSVLKYEFEQLLHGETVTFSKKPAWDDFLVTDAGRAYIAHVHAQYPGIEIQVQTTRRVVSLWGPVIMRHRACQEIVRKIVELKARQFWKIPLSGKLLSIFRSAELTTLQELLGAENCILDFGERVLVVRGNDTAFRTACQAVQDAQSRESHETRSSDTVCPVCFGEAVVPVSLACGHQWCRACLTGYLTSAVENKSFPLKCLGNNATCSQCIPLGLSRKLLSAEDFNAVLEAAFWVYVHSRPDEFHHCPTPDCTQVYRTAPLNSVLQCPSCLVRICPACRIESHDGMTCEERDVAEDKLFNEWTTNHDVKSCPGCKVPIERSEGCNHMTCTRCQTHICWECMATFPRGQGIYNHMRIQHGGIGL